MYARESRGILSQNFSILYRKVYGACEIRQSEDKNIITLFFFSISLIEVSSIFRSHNNETYLKYVHVLFFLNRNVIMNVVIMCRY